MQSQSAKTREIRSRLNHPIIDSDGHLREFTPVIMEYYRKVGGADIAKIIQNEERFTARDPSWYEKNETQRRDEWTKRPSFWSVPLRNHGLDLATSLFPDLMYDRLDEMGIDFTVLYPSIAFFPQTYPTDEVRRACCRALNDYYADLWTSHPDRIMPVAAIPMHTPQEAIEEIEYAVGKRGLKAIVLPSYVRRPIKSVSGNDRELSRYAYRLDTFGIDSEYDYDPVWAKCQELKVIPTFHGPGEGLSLRNSISNIVYNHVGHFASAADALCKSLFLGGVPLRFPKLKFLFLEGGVGFARSLLADLPSHWEKRGLAGLANNTDPHRFNAELFMDLYKKKAGPLYRDLSKEALTTLYGTRGKPSDPTDAFARAPFKSKKEMREVFVNAFYFGCEGDDPVMASAFDTPRNPGRLRLNAVYGSDISHWDVPDMSEVLEEAYEPVEKGMITPDDFRDFVFTNAVNMWTSVNPDFFKGTAVESAVSAYQRQEMAKTKERAA